MCVPCQHFGQRFRSRTLIHEPLRSGRRIVRIVRIVRRFFADFSPSITSNSSRQWRRSTFSKSKVQKSIPQIRPKSGQDRYGFELRYQEAPKAGQKYVEMVGLQKLQIQSASLVAIGANPLDFLPTASPSSHHPHRPPGPVNLWFLFPRTYFFLPGTFSRKTFSDRLRTAPLTVAVNAAGPVMDRHRQWRPGKRPVTQTAPLTGLPGP